MKTVLKILLTIGLVIISVFIVYFLFGNFLPSRQTSKTEIHDGTQRSIKQDNTNVESYQVNKKSIIDKLELVECKTGFYANYDNNRGIISSCQPIVIMKFKNISNEPLNEGIEIEGVFIDKKKGEELSKD